jgi:exopolysaccharide production protein ExoZ
MKLGSIQFLRAIAAILVVYAHSIDLQVQYTHSFQQNLYYLQDFGAFGVDIFFVISGFIISYSADRYKGGREGMQFLIKRFKRVNTVYYLATLLLLVTYIPSIFIRHTRVIPFDIILKSLVLLPVFDKGTFIDTILFPAWTLSFEWLFYLFFFWAIVSRTRSKERFLALLISALVITGFLFNRFKGGNYQLSFITNPILLEFLLGIGLYGCYTKMNIPKKMAITFLVTGSCICCYEIIKGYGTISLAYNTLDGSQSFIRFIKWGIPAGLLVAGCIFLEKARCGISFWNSRPIALLGDASYSIYLVNYTVNGLCAAVYMRAGFFLNPDLAVGLQLLLAISGGILFYKAVEKPLLKLLHKRLHPGPVS